MSGMWYNIGGARRMKRAQAMLEYVLALAGMAVVASVVHSSSPMENSKMIKIRFILA